MTLALLLPWIAQAEERVLELPGGDAIHYRVVEGEADSARPTALRILRFLADGNIEDAALLSNAPKRRFEVLQDYRARVGDEEFKRVYAQYFFPENHVVAELAVDARRLVIWDLGEAGHRLSAQYFVAVDGRFLMDDVPSAERAKMRRLLELYRKENAKRATSPAQKD
ncbi:MAG TPA: hypothetical protein VI321_06780 [Burkholderiales bacterium]